MSTKTGTERARDVGAKAPDAEAQTFELPVADTSVRALQTELRGFGWPLAVDGVAGKQTFEAVWDFQRGFAWWDLLIDGFAGPKTWEAIEYVRTAEGRCSPNFAYREFKSRGNGWIKVSRDLARALEEYRELVGKPVVVRSAYRDPKHNSNVGGVPNSQHLFGNSIDLAQPEIGYAKVKALGVFSGIGIIRASGIALHLDVRHVGPNTTGGTPARPSIWYYG
jgi:hypothetical protein